MPVSVTAERSSVKGAEIAPVRAASGLIHVIELPDRAVIRVEAGVSSELVRTSFGESLAVIELKSGTRIWIASAVI